METGAPELAYGSGRSVATVNKCFVRALQRLVPDVRSEDLETSPAGVRAQAMNSRGDLADDFLITESKSSMHVLNAPSPAATASLEIAGRIVQMIDARSS